MVSLFHLPDMINLSTEKKGCTKTIGSLRKRRLLPGEAEKKRAEIIQAAKEK